MKKILLSKMFVGEYNENSIGHEVINFYLPDNCEDSFIYNPPYGKGQKVDDVILLGIPERFAYPVLAIALDVEKIEHNLCEEQANNLKYGGKTLKEIDFDQFTPTSTKKQKDTTLLVSHFTYKVKKGNLKKLPNNLLDGTVKQVMQQMYIIPATNNKFSKEMQENRIKELQSKNCKVIVLENENPQHSCAYCNCNEEYNSSLFEFINEAYKYENYDLKPIQLSKTLTNIDNNSFLNFIGKEFSEQAFTNMFYNVLTNGNTEYRRNFVKFLINHHNLENGTNYSLSSLQDFVIAKEKITTDTSRKGRLDLLIYNKEYIVIVENKINSNINGIYEENGITFSQLDKYKEYAEKLKINNNLQNADILVFVFMPNYSLIKQIVGVNSITYKELHKFFTQHPLLNFNEMFYKEFVNGLLLHSLTREEDINRRFINFLNK
ncbi:MAG: PD-(D/E)XK nuclease family protein [Clostridia bacterium]|nr:PD-(D/E)XK nuclease family protein [Clostridia bacterium]